MTAESAVPRQAFSRAMEHPQNLEAIGSFLDPKQQKEFPEICKLIHQDSALRNGRDLNQYLKYRYPFLKIGNVEKARKVFEGLQCNPAYLRETNFVTGSTPAWNAFKEKNYKLAAWYLEKGGLFAVTEVQKKTLCSYPLLLVDYPEISVRIRNAKWEGAMTGEQKQAVLQQLLEEYCHKGHLKGIKWVLKKAEDNRCLLALQKPLELAIYGGFGDIVSELCPLMTGEKEASVAALCVQMGYPALLPILKKYGFPVSAGQEQQMEELVSTQNGLASRISFPQAPNAISHGAHGGDANKAVREQEYREMVGYVYHSLRNGVSIRVLIENLLHRRRRMAVRCNLQELHHYGTPTDRPMGTRFDSSYKAFGDRIKEKYAEFPVKVTTRIKDQEIPLTTITAEQWEHPDGKHRDLILDEVARLCEPLRTKLQTDLATPLSPVIWLISLAPPCLRGTPIVLRALVDGICLFQQRDPIDPSYEINCDALVYADQREFTKAFSARAPLPQRTAS